MSKIARFERHLFSALIIMLGSSALLFEGFVCVAFFLPIYIVISALVFFLSPDVKDTDRSKLRASVLPLVIMVLSVEGVSPSLSFERNKTVSRTQIVDATIPQIKANMAKPITFDGRRHAFLSIFPLPVNVEAGSLNAGDVHKLHFTYKRWGFTNVHEGETWLKIAEVGDDFVRTEIVKDTSYFSKYLTIKGTQVDMKTLPSGQTEVTLIVKYKRLLDPVWYFGPLQNMAVKQSADYLIEEVIARDLPQSR
ncbi:MAG: hypothetical protein ACPGVT_03470 [Maricaulaceae bacterium]